MLLARARRHDRDGGLRPRRASRRSTRSPRCWAASMPIEIAPAIGFLIAQPRQGRLGVGWRGVAALDVAHAAERDADRADVDAALERLAAASGSGSAGTRRSGCSATSLARDDRRRVGLPDARDPRRVAHGRARRRAARRGRARLGPCRRDRAACRDALGRPGRDRPASPSPATADALAERRTRRSDARCCRCSPSTAGVRGRGARDVAGEASVEYKLDGARIQVHRHGDDVQVYTRNLADITHRVPEIVELRRARSRSPTSSSTVRRCRSTTTARRARSRTRWRASAPMPIGATSPCGRGSSTCCTSTAAT